MSDTPKRIKPSEAASITPIKREAGKAVVQPAEVKAEDFSEYFKHLYRGEDIKNLPPTEWILRGRLVKRGLTALYSAPGVGKSFVAIDMGLAASLGESWWGENFPANCKVLYIAAERFSEVRDRLEAACKKRGVAIPKNFVTYARPQALQVIEHGEPLLAIAELEKPDVIIFDTFAKMTLGKKENESNESGPIVEMFGRIVAAAGEQCGGLIIHHAGKDETKGLRGSTALLGALDGVWKLDKQEGGGLALSVEKLNAAEAPLPAYFRIEGVDMPDPQEPGELRSVGVLTSQGYAQVADGIEGKVLALLCDGFEEEGASTAQLLDEFNRTYRPKAADADKLSRRSMNRAVSTLQNRKAAEKIGEGVRTKYKPTAKALEEYRAGKAEE
jgi:hypothetical protein